MFQCSWLINNTQCTNTTDRLVCTECEEEKSRLYHQYKEAEKTVVSAINDALPRGDLLEASKVIRRITRVVRLRQKFTSRLAPQSRDAGHEYYVATLLRKIEEYHTYISEHITKTVPKELSTEPTTTTEYQSYQQPLITAIQTVVESDPFAEYDAAIQEYQRGQAQYHEAFAKMETLTGYKGEKVKLIIIFVATLRHAIDQLLHRLTHITRGGKIEFVFNRHFCDIDHLSHETCITYMSDVMESNLLFHTYIIDWVVLHVRDTANICCRTITINGRNQLVVAIRVGHRYCPTLFYVALRFSNDEGYQIGLTAVAMTSDIEERLKVKEPCILRKHYKKTQ